MAKEQNVIETAGVIKGVNMKAGGVPKSGAGSRKALNPVRRCSPNVFCNTFFERVKQWF